MTIKDWNIKEMTGYEPITTYYQDFSIADKFGIDAILDTFKRATGMDGYARSDYKVMTELYMVMNWKIWEYYKSNMEYAKIYESLQYKIEQIVELSFGVDELEYFYKTID